ncbi:unnamed protein product, partial [Ectocarpus sp. 12 AP-2014]
EAILICGSSRSCEPSGVRNSRFHVLGFNDAEITTYKCRPDRGSPPVLKVWLFAGKHLTVVESRNIHLVVSVYSIAPVLPHPVFPTNHKCIAGPLIPIHSQGAARTCPL